MTDKILECNEKHLRLLRETADTIAEYQQETKGISDTVKRLGAKASQGEMAAYAVQMIIEYLEFLQLTKGQQ